jgi:hypothetical protein
MGMEYLYSKETGEILKAFYDVYNELGPQQRRIIFTNDRKKNHSKNQ